MSEKEHYYLFTFSLTADGHQWFDSIIKGLPHPCVTMPDILEVKEHFSREGDTSAPGWVLTATSYLGEMTAEEFGGDAFKVKAEAG